MTLEMKPLAEVTRRAIEVLSREMGPVDAARFINQFTTGHGDYTADRDAMFGSESLDQILSDIKQTVTGDHSCPGAPPDLNPSSP